jgi:hypothetical protein
MSQWQRMLQDAKVMEVVIRNIVGWLQSLPSRGNRRRG